MNGLAASCTLTVFFLLVLTGCVAGPKPYSEYSLAFVALDAAKRAEAPRYASGYWTKAESLYRQGEQAYKVNDNTAAQEYFQQARKYAEKAENATRLKKFQSGGGP